MVRLFFLKLYMRVLNQNNIAFFTLAKIALLVDVKYFLFIQNTTNRIIGHSSAFNKLLHNWSRLGLLGVWGTPIDGDYKASQRTAIRAISIFVSATSLLQADPKKNHRRKA